MSILGEPLAGHYSCFTHVLRVLLLENVYPDADMDCVIEAPILHNLTLISCTDDWRFGELPHLQCACINVPHYLWGGTAAFVECLTGVSQARELILYLPTVHYLILPIIITITLFFFCLFGMNHSCMD